MNTVDDLFSGPPRRNDREWHGEPHTLVVRAYTPPTDGLWNDEYLDYEIQHPASCRQETAGEGEHSYLVYTCDIAYHEEDCGLAFALRYSGTPVTEPGTCRIQGWGRKIWTECGDEYDGGVCIIDEGNGRMGTVDDLIAALQALSPEQRALAPFRANGDLPPVQVTAVVVSPADYGQEVLIT
jgi:hypothetical protein